MANPDPFPSGPRLSRRALSSKAFWSGLLAVVVAGVIVIGTVVGASIGRVRSAQAEAAAVATVQAEMAAVATAQARPVAVPTARVETARATAQAARPGASGPAATRLAALANGDQPAPARPAHAGRILDVSGDVITVKTRRGPTVRVMVGPGTTYWRRGQRVTQQELVAGRAILILGRPNDQSRTIQARAIAIDPPAPRW